jgi:hypothetical protein
LSRADSESQFPQIDELDDNVFEEQEVPHDLSEERPLPRRNPIRREERISRDRSPLEEFRPRKWGRVQYSPEPDLTAKRQAKKDKTRNKPSTSNALPLVIEAPNQNEPIINEPEDIESEYDDAPRLRKIPKQSEVMDEDLIPLFTPGAQRAIKKKRRPTKEISLPQRHPSREIAIRQMPIDIDYHFFTPGASAMFGDPRPVFDDSMPTKKRRQEYNIEMPSASQPLALAAGPSQSQVAGLSRSAIGAPNQNVALPAPKSVAAIKGPTQLAIAGPLRGRDRQHQLAVETAPEQQVALREVQQVLLQRKPRRKANKPYGNIRR